MAINDYVCSECSFKDEYNSSKSVPKEMNPPEFCPKCGKGKMERIFSSEGGSFDIVGGSNLKKFNWKKKVGPDAAAKVLTGESNNPY